MTGGTGPGAEIWRKAKASGRTITLLLAHFGGDRFVIGERGKIGSLDELSRLASNGQP